MSPLALALITSVAVHVAGVGVFAAMVPPKIPQGEKSEHDAREKDRSEQGNQPKSFEATAMRARVLPALASEATPREGERARPAKDCPGSHYDGIGIQFTDSGMVTMVGTGGPAELAGVRTGDTIVHADPLILGPGKYPIGTEITMVLRRGAVHKRVKARMKVAEICYDSGPGG